MKTSTLHKVTLAAHIALPGHPDLMDDLKHLLRWGRSPDEFLDFLHLMLKVTDVSEDDVRALDRILERGGSVWRATERGLVSEPLGPGLPTVREWTTERYTCAGYVNGSPPPADREELRAELGYRPGERVCVVTVGGSGVGGHLLRLVTDAFPLAEKRIPELRMIAVTGPWLDPAAFSVPEGVELHGFVPDLNRHLAACDLAVVQGGLTTTMELVAAGRPFLYFPLGHHFEQQVHVPQRLAQYRAGRRIDYTDIDHERLIEAMAAEIDRPLDYRPVETDGAARAAALLAELL